MDYQTYQYKLQNLVSSLCREISNVFQLPTIDATTDLEEIVERMGGNIVYIYEKTATVCKLSDESFLITLSSQFDDREAAWNIAQLLGNLFIHMGYLTSTAKWEMTKPLTSYECHGYDEQEITNLFAGFFLMPRHEFKKIIDKYTTGTDIDIRKVAKHFGVSISTAHWWGVRTGYIQPDFP